MASTVYETDNCGAALFLDHDYRYRELFLPQFNSKLQTEI